MHRLKSLIFMIAKTLKAIYYHCKLNILKYFAMFAFSTLRTKCKLWKRNWPSKECKTIFYLNKMDGLNIIKASIIKGSSIRTDANFFAFWSNTICSCKSCWFINFLGITIRYLSKHLKKLVSYFRSYLYLTVTFWKYIFS